MADRDVIPFDSARASERNHPEAFAFNSMLTDSIAATASVTGTAYYEALARYLTQSLDIRYVLIGEVFQWNGAQPKRMRSLCFYDRNHVLENLECDLSGTACEQLFRAIPSPSDGEIVYCVPNDLQRKFPAVSRLFPTTEAYLGIALIDSSTHSFIGHICLLDDRPLPELKRQHAKILLKFFAARTTAELKRQQAENREREKVRQLEQALEVLQRTQSQLVQTEKISSLGQLVAGVAHEINNPLACLTGNLNHVNEYVLDLAKHLELYRQYVPNPAPAIEEHAEDIDLDFVLEDLSPMLASMTVSVERIEKIVTSLRQFSRLDAETVPFDVREGLDSTLVVLQHRLKANESRPAIQVVREYSDLPLVPCRPGQLNQVFMNLLSNAIDALEEASEGCTFTALQNKPNVIRIRIQHIRDEVGSRVAICIADNGVGIPEDVKPHLFETFFTTKPTGKGTGLGLSLSYQIVTEYHGGTLSFDSTLDRGTEFIIELPIQ
ncbi:MAG: ATPase [Cyanobacteria bacterium SID2]|nr:ATPase [Cyanobacteria bacterium SID2]MBP0002948.1 ATPase [Cyanobacteria bacterium SBC]